jgi:hypothetical protein
VATTIITIEVEITATEGAMGNGGLTTTKTARTTRKLKAPHYVIPRLPIFIVMFKDLR